MPSDSQEQDLRVYHIGNSLTRNVPLERLQQLFASAGGKYDYGIQLGGGLRLSQHLVKRNHAGPPGSGKYNLIEKFCQRVQPYYIKARGPKSPFNPRTFQRDAGVLNLYADGVHMNDQPHNGDDSGTIGSYVAALTIYATLTGQSPVGMTVEPYEMFEAKADAELIDALQQTVWNVVAGHRHTGVKER